MRYLRGVGASVLVLLFYSNHVACDGSSSGRVSTGEALPERRTPHAVPIHALALVANGQSDSVSVIDLARNLVAQHAPVGLDPLAIDGPNRIVVDRDHAFVLLPYPTAGGSHHAGHGASALPGVLSKVRLDDLSRVSALTLSVTPTDLVLSSDGRSVAIGHEDGTVLFADTATMERTWSLRPCAGAEGMSRAGEALFIACDDAVAVTAFPRGSAVKLLPITGSPSFVVGAADGALLVGEREGRALRLLDAAGVTQSRLVLDREPLLPALDGTTWIVPLRASDELVRVDATLAITATRAFPSTECSRPRQVAAHGGRYFVVCEGTHEDESHVVEIAPATLATLRTFTVGVRPESISFAGRP